MHVFFLAMMSRLLAIIQLHAHFRLVYSTYQEYTIYGSTLAPRQSWHKKRHVELSKQNFINSHGFIMSHKMCNNLQIVAQFMNPQIAQCNLYTAQIHRLRLTES